MHEFITNPKLIEKKSMEIIEEILGKVDFTPQELKVVKRVIHTTADFEYADILELNHQPLQAMAQALREGVHIVTDTRMAWSGINKRVPTQHQVDVKCFMSDRETAQIAKENGITRAMACMRRAAEDKKNGIFVIGNAPTALVELLKLTEAGIINPAVIIGVPVGFVGAAESKDLLGETNIPHILTRHRKGGSNVAAAIVNAICYMVEEGQL